MPIRKTGRGRKKLRKSRRNKVGGSLWWKPQRTHVYTTYTTASGTAKV